MKFAQIIEFRTGRIDDFNANLDAWMTRTEGNRIAHRAVVRRDRDACDQYQLLTEFPSYDQGMQNSNRAETAEFATSWPGSPTDR